MWSLHDLGNARMSLENFFSFVLWLNAPNKPPRRRFGCSLSRDGWVPFIEDFKLEGFFERNWWQNGVHNILDLEYARLITLFLVKWVFVDICFFAWKLKSYLNLYLSSSCVEKELLRIAHTFWSRNVKSEWIVLCCPCWTSWIREVCVACWIIPELMLKIAP